MAGLINQLYHQHHHRARDRGLMYAKHAKGGLPICDTVAMLDIFYRMAPSGSHFQSNLSSIAAQGVIKQTVSITVQYEVDL